MQTDKIDRNTESSQAKSDAFGPPTQTNSDHDGARHCDESGLLSFISRRNLTEGRFTPALVEVFNPETTMTREFGVVHLDDAYLSPATRRFIELVKAVAQVEGSRTQ